MGTVYKPLFKIRLRHSFYVSGQSTEDFFLAPNLSTWQRLEDYGFIFRALADGCAVYAEVEPETSPPTPLRPIGDDTLRFQFHLHSRNPYLLNMSELTGHRPGRSTFYFNNLRDDQENNRLHLGDSIAGGRLGTPIWLVTGGTHTYRFAAPVNRASLDLTDIFDKSLHSTTFQIPDPKESTSELRLELAPIKSLPPGRYKLSDNNDGTQDLYYDPQLFGTRPLGIIEIFSRTDTLTPDGTERVPDGYRFLAGNQVKDLEYHIQLESRATTWRYNVIKKYDDNQVELDNLAVSGSIRFDKALGDNRAVFTSKEEVPLSQAQRSLSLVENNTSPSAELRSLPNPSPSTVLKKGTDSGHFVSDMYIYV